MSSSLSVYLLDPKAARALVGSGDDQLLDVIRDRFGDDLAADDRYFSSRIAEGAPTAYEALRAVVHGGPYDEEYAFQYGYAYKRLCSLTGSFLDNSSFCPFRGDWLETVDEGLRALRIKAVSVADFGYGGLPGGIPSYDLPRCGEWTHEECLEALEQFERTKQEGHAPPLEPEVVDAVMDVIGWLRHAEARPGLGVVGFVS
ncbi:hypothetical protein E2C00_07260 [Streptomyces sp. WAC05374]|uniref:DUF7691 family protein n=1 Tax=Streptomyces sp. WAC05374 TaxID=2487420 RepID=UPI000F896691|nr:hypothetical protein [Streptomyces sp. WAC05374]RST15178.1 hypothetical protein EF905_15650 [Streptomyces sp. WAC05374]TDF45286.1 hypothetical protein E2B92_13330 [Streptomyces sp. WAC05374]TDF55726.1 hypothetical protein E2C02_14370 [Streptomyces sp. WAC05374]TDF58864.1 hypothetical protein E2C00_07260 [Streptomyces sp. WAC05374]